MPAHSQLKPFAEAIGEMCNEWAHLEQWVNRLFLAIGGWDYRLPNALLMSGILGIRDQIEASKIGAINRCAHGDFLNAVIDCLNYIDNDLRNSRNQFVHHIWSPAGDGKGAIKVDVTARAGKKPGTTVRMIHPWENTYLDIEEVREVITDIVNEREHLTELVRYFQSRDQKEVERLVQLVKPPPRLHLHRRVERQSQKDKADAKQKPQRKS